MKKQHLITFTIAAFLIIFSLHTVHAQTSIAEVCGSTPTSPKCTFTDFKTVYNGAIALAIKLGLVAMGLFISVRVIIAWKERVEGNAGALKAARSQIGNGLVGFFVVVAVVTLLATALKFFGVSDNLLKLISGAFFSHTYAADPTYLTNPTGVNSIYDFILLVVKLVMSFFVYPALIVMWVWSGFAYVLAQGNPEGIKKAHQWLTWAVGSTIVIFMIQGFLIALQGTVNNIIPNTKTSQSTQPPVSDNGLSATNQPVGTICYSSANCATGLFCDSNGDKGTCQKTPTSYKAVPSDKCPNPMPVDNNTRIPCSDPTGAVVGTGWCFGNGMCNIGQNN